MPHPDRWVGRGRQLVLPSGRRQPPESLKAHEERDDREDHHHGDADEQHGDPATAGPRRSARSAAARRARRRAARAPRGPARRRRRARRARTAVVSSESRPWRPTPRSTRSAAWPSAASSSTGSCSMIVMSVGSTGLPHLVACRHDGQLRGSLSAPDRSNRQGSKPKTRAVEVQLGLERPPDVRRLAEPVLLALEGEVGDRHPLAPAARRRSSRTAPAARPRPRGPGGR